ncbi:glutathione peroxidase [Candidatus Riflebacteria bacterium]
MKNKFYGMFFIIFFITFHISAQPQIKKEHQKGKKLQKKKAILYSFKVKTINGDIESLEKYKGRVILIVNTASHCGFTPQFAGLEKLYKENKDKGFVILGFPCNQFGNQDPGTDKEIQQFCQLNYGVSFPMFSKIEVNGDNAEPLFKYLKDSLPGFLGFNSIKWNFTKFLIDREGKPINRFSSLSKPGELLKAIQPLLEKK